MTPEQIFYGSVVVIILIVANLVMLIYNISQARRNSESKIISAKNLEICRPREEIARKQSTIDRNLRAMSEQSKRTNV